MLNNSSYKPQISTNDFRDYLSWQNSDFWEKLSTNPILKCRGEEIPSSYQQFDL